jgi:glucokinase
MAYCIGIDLGGTAIKAGLTDSNGDIKDFFQIPTGVEANSSDVVVENIKKCIAQLIDKNRNVKVTAIGIGVPGISLDNGNITIFANIRVFDNYPLAAEIQSVFDIPTFVDNDANNAASGEFLFGVAKGKRHFLLVTLGTGIGAGIYVNGAIYKGANGGAGEVGHMVIVPDGRLCGCGNNGCWETYGSASSMIRRASSMLGRGVDSSLEKYYPNDLNAKVIEEEARGGDPLAVDLFSETAHYIGVGLANLINCFNPELIVIGGGLSNAGDFLLDKVKFSAKLNSAPPAWSAVEIKTATLGNKAGILGSAALAFIKSETV